ncbi:MAG: hypothetical protein IJJ15_09610 [Ruminococcus sp.]|nr:hypothetical protein [Ruminococcus sp.]
MKKNKVMRIASVLLIVTLLSTCAISGTFAKYVVTGAAEAEARVAKWGVTVDVKGQLTDTSYATDDESYSPYNSSDNSVTVKARTDVVAPGTKAPTVDGIEGMQATITGKPEVATRFQLTFNSDWTEITLPAGEYRDWTSSDPEDTFTLEEDYKPIVLKLTFTKASGNTNHSFTVEGGVEDIITKLNSFTGGDDDLTADFAPNSDVNATFKLTWVWPFEVGDQVEDLAGDCTYEDTTIRDKADTFLGNAIAVQLGQQIEGFEMPEDIVLTESFDVSAAAVQID